MKCLKSTKRPGPDMKDLQWNCSADSPLQIRSNLQCNTVDGGFQNPIHMYWEKIHIEILKSAACTFCGGNAHFKLGSQVAAADR